MGYSLELTSAPSEEPVTLAEAKAHLRFDPTDEDTLISSLITRARTEAENFTRRALVTQTWKQRMDRFPGWTVWLAKPPVQSVTSIEYIDTDGNSQTLAASQYDVDLYSIQARITPAYGQNWPSIRNILNAVTITFVAGYGGAEDVPEPIKGAILHMVAHWFDNREEVTDRPVNELPMAAKAMLYPYRVEA